MSDPSPNNSDVGSNHSVENQTPLPGFPANQTGNTISLNTVISQEGVTLKDFVISTVGESNASLINGLEHRIKEIINNSLDRLAPGTTRDIQNPSVNINKTPTASLQINKQQAIVTQQQRSNITPQQQPNLSPPIQHTINNREPVENRFNNLQLNNVVQQQDIYSTQSASSSREGSVNFITARGIQNTRIPVGSTRYSNFHQREEVELHIPNVENVPNVQNIPNQQEEQFVQARYNRNDRLLDVTRWNLKFDGSSKSISVDDFVFRVQTLQEMYEVPWPEVLSKFNLLLEGGASDWYWDFVRQYRIHNWTQLKTAITKAFRKYQNDTEVIKELLSRRQRHTESFEEYVREMCKLRNQAASPMSEKDLITLIKGNLKGLMQQLLFPINSYSIESFIMEGRRAETIMRNNSSQSNRKDFRVYEVEHPVEDFANMSICNPNENFKEVDSEIDPEIAAVAMKNISRCYNCKKEGHHFIYCPIPQRNLFCYKCGLENVVTPKCPRCSGNSKQSVSAAGTTRSMEPQTSSKIN